MLGVLDDRAIEHLLQSELVARIACYADENLYVVPVTYVYDRGALIGHSADGRKVQMMRKNPDVCVEVDRVANLANWRSVIAYGRYEELGGKEAEEALSLLMARLVPIVASETSRPSREMMPSTHGRQVKGQVPIVFRIRLAEKTGRFERLP
jgi:nitroimidazol reductase NimA-like FMN-containing flavoprotein (pyridoxamine 5'-phosphate oxidase superfamily)